MVEILGRLLTATDLIDAYDAVVVNALEISKQGKVLCYTCAETCDFNKCGQLERIKDFKKDNEITSGIMESMT